MPTASPDRCTSKPKSIALPVLSGKATNPWQSGHDKIKHSRIGRWRAAALILVHVAIAVHLLLWLRMGRTVSPVEPSESMQTLREGAVNAGFVFFVLALVATLVFGRFFCGWGCHMIALQDLCSWIMMKLGIRPKPFRSRLLLWVPLGLAIYMFVWPVLHRTVVRPLLMDSRGRVPWILGQSDPIPGISTEFIVEDFWATFGPWWMAAPFALTCTFAVVYFLGSKGFCTYGCPYGGFFAPADRLAPGKIRVTDACHQCGHCTAVCTSNVRVHEEVRDFGMVVDPGCMKCMDCVSVCPNDALYFGFGKPSVLAAPRSDAARQTRAQAKALRAARYDLKLYEEVAVLALFLLYFYAFRGLLNHIPMLMAVAIGGIMAFCTWKLWRMRPVALGGTPNIRLQSQQLRYRARWTPAGYVLATGTVLGMAIAAWGAYVKLHRFEADRLYSRLSTPLPITLRPDYQPTPEEAAIARRATRLLKRSDSIFRAGHGWPLTPDQELNLSYMAIVLGDFAESQRRMERVIDIGNPQDSLIQQVAQLMQAEAARQAPGGQLTSDQARALDDRIVALHEHALSHHPDLDGARLFLSARALQKNLQPPAAEGQPPTFAPESIAAARAMWDQPARLKVPRPATFLNMARLEMAIDGQGPRADQARQRALALVDRAIAALHGPSADDRLAIAAMLAQLGQTERALEMAHQAVTAGPSAGMPEVAAAGFLLQLQRSDKAAPLIESGVARASALGPHSGQMSTLVSAAGHLVQLGRLDDALELYRQAAVIARGAESSAWDLHALGLQLLQVGQQQQQGPYLTEGIRVLELARDADPDASVIRHDLGFAYYVLNRRDDALREFTAAANLADGSVYLARHLSGLLAEMGRVQESVQWEKVAQQRESAAAAAPPTPRPDRP